MFCRTKDLRGIWLPRGDVMLILPGRSLGDGPAARLGWGLKRIAASLGAAATR